MKSSFPKPRDLRVSSAIRLCAVEEVEEGEPLAVSCEGLPQLAVYCVDNAYYVTDNRCTHGQAELSDGMQEGTTIECPFHGGSFDIVTGAPTSHPCQVALRTYRAWVEDGAVMIDSGSSQEAVP